MFLIAVKIIIFRSINLNYYYKYYYSISYPPDTYRVQCMHCIHVRMCAHASVGFVRMLMCMYACMCAVHLKQ